jgi:hypothetical protein
LIKTKARKWIVSDEAGGWLQKGAYSRSIGALDSIDVVKGKVGKRTTLPFIISIYVLSILISPEGSCVRTLGATLATS